MRRPWGLLVAQSDSAASRPTACRDDLWNAPTRAGYGFGRWRGDHVIDPLRRSSASPTSASVRPSRWAALNRSVADAAPRADPHEASAGLAAQDGSRAAPRRWQIDLGGLPALVGRTLRANHEAPAARGYPQPEIHRLCLCDSHPAVSSKDPHRWRVRTAADAGATRAVSAVSTTRFMRRRMVPCRVGTAKLSLGSDAGQTRRFGIGAGASPLYVTRLTNGEVIGSLRPRFTRTGRVARMHGRTAGGVNRVARP